MIDFFARSEIRQISAMIVEKFGTKDDGLLGIFGSPEMFSCRRADNCSFIAESESSVFVGQCFVEYKWPFSICRGLAISEWTWDTADAVQVSRLQVCITEALAGSRVRGKTFFARDLPEPWVYFGRQYFPSSVVMKTPSLYFGGSEFACNVARIVNGIDMWENRSPQA